MDFVRVPDWSRFSWLRHGFSARAGGLSTVYGGRSLNLGFTKEDDPVVVRENRRLFARAVTGATTDGTAIALRQVHTVDLHVVRSLQEPFETSEGLALLEGDGLMTDQPRALLGIQTADCVPVMVIDPANRAVAVFHAGWRGTVGGIVEAGIARLAAEYGSRPEGLLAAVGPSIGACCYTVGEEVRTSFQERFSYADRLFDKDRLDLWQANRLQLLNAGVPSENISVVGECTGCALNAAGQRKYFSHRIDHGFTGRMMSLVSVVPA